MKMILLVLICAIALSSAEGDIEVPTPSHLCNQQESMFDNSTVVYSECQENIDAIIEHQITSSHHFETLFEFAQQYQHNPDFSDYDIHDPLFDGFIVAVTPHEDSMSLQHDHAKIIEVKLSDRTVYFIRHESSWQVFTVLPTTD